MRRCNYSIVLLFFLLINNLSLANPGTLASQRFTELLRVSIAASPFALAMGVISHYYKHFADERALSSVEDAWVRTQVQLCGSKIPDGIKLTMNNNEPEASSRVDRIVLNRMWLRQAQENLEGEVKAKLEGAVLNAVGHLKNDDPRQIARVALGVPVATQGGLAMCSLLMKKILTVPSVTPTVICTCARLSVWGGAAAGSAFSVLMYARYREICADNEVKYHPAQGRAYASYLFNRQKKIEQSQLYCTYKGFYEFLSAQPLSEHRAKRLERYAKKTELILNNGGCISSEGTPSFVCNVTSLVKQKAFALFPQVQRERVHCKEQKE